MSIDEEMWEIANDPEMWKIVNGKEYNHGLDVAGLKGLCYFIKFYLARGSKKKYDIWLNVLIHDKSLPRKIQEAAFEVYANEEIAP